MSGLINARENYKDLPNAKTALRVFSGGPFGVEWDDLYIEYPTNTTEEYKYYLETELQVTVVVTYDSPLKKNIIRVQKV